MARGGASNAVANIKNRPAKAGGTVSPRRRSKTTSSELGLIQPRLIQATIRGTISACGSVDVMVVVRSWLPSAVIVALFWLQSDGLSQCPIALFPEVGRFSVAIRPWKEDAVLSQ